MLKQYLAGFILLTIGAVAGILLANRSADEPVTTGSKSIGTLSSQEIDTTGRQSTMATTTGGYVMVEKERLAALEAEITGLRERVQSLETTVAVVTPADVDTTISGSTTAGPAVTGFPGGPGNFNQVSSNAVISGLIAAGLDPVSAEEIARRQSETELARLELRDKAIREGYMGSSQFREEMRELRESEVRIREEVGENSYDRFLYHTGQPNRVTVESVMLGSAAEDIGIQPGDVLYRYEDQRLYSWGDLRSRTTLGERGESVNLTVLRGGSEVTMSIPRGPLGVRLNAISVDPASEDSGGG